MGTGTRPEECVMPQTINTNIVSLNAQRNPVSYTHLRAHET